MQTIRDGGSAIVIDDRWAPVYVCTWFGEATEAIARGYFGWNHRLLAEQIRTKTPTLLITDATDAVRPPPKVRALMAELGDASPRGDGFIFVYMVMPSALVRGALTAMQWLSRKPWPIEMVSSMGEALHRGLADLERAGGKRPVGLDVRAYARPARPAA